MSGKLAQAACVMSMYLRCGRVGFSTTRQATIRLPDTYPIVPLRALTTTSDPFNSIQGTSKGGKNLLSNENRKSKVHDFYSVEVSKKELSTKPKKLKKRQGSMVQHDGNLLLEQGLSDHLQIQILGEGVKGSVLVRPNNVTEDSPWLNIAVRVRSYFTNYVSGVVNYGPYSDYIKSGNKTKSLEKSTKSPLVFVLLEDKSVWYFPAKLMQAKALKPIFNMKKGSRHDKLLRRSLSPTNNMPFLANDLIKAYFSGKYNMGSLEDFTTPISEKCKTEMESRMIGNKLLDIMGLEFTNPKYTYDVVDGIITYNGVDINVQEKTTSSTKTSYATLACPLGTLKTGKKRPYDVNDFDLLMAYYPPSHCKRETAIFVIPTYALLEHKLVKDRKNKIKGQKSVSLVDPDFEREKKRKNVWACQYEVDLTDSEDAQSKMTAILESILTWKKNGKVEIPFLITPPSNGFITDDGYLVVDISNQKSAKSTRKSTDSNSRKKSTKKKENLLTKMKLLEPPKQKLALPSPELTTNTDDKNNKNNKKSKKEKQNLLKSGKKLKKSGMLLEEQQVQKSPAPPPEKKKLAPPTKLDFPIPKSTKNKKAGKCFSTSASASTKTAKSTSSSTKTANKKRFSKDSKDESSLVQKMVQGVMTALWPS